MNSQACNERWERESGRTARTIKEWLREIGRNHNALVFPNVRGEPLSRFAIHLLLAKRPSEQVSAAQV